LAAALSAYRKSPAANSVYQRSGLSEAVRNVGHSAAAVERELKKIGVGILGLCFPAMTGAPELIVC
jgi:hypothetical protein